MSGMDTPTSRTLLHLDAANDSPRARAASNRPGDSPPLRCGKVRGSSAFISILAVSFVVGLLSALTWGFVQSNSTKSTQHSSLLARFDNVQADVAEMIRGMLLLPFDSGRRIAWATSDALRHDLGLDTQLFSTLAAATQNHYQYITDIQYLRALGDDEPVGDWLAAMEAASNMSVSIEHAATASVTFRGQTVHHVVSQLNANFSLITQSEDHLGAPATRQAVLEALSNASSITAPMTDGRCGTGPALWSYMPVFAEALPADTAPSSATSHNVTVGIPAAPITPVGTAIEDHGPVHGAVGILLCSSSLTSMVQAALCFNSQSEATIAGVKPVRHGRTIGGFLIQDVTGDLPYTSGMPLYSKDACVFGFNDVDLSLGSPITSSVFNEDTSAWHTSSTGADDATLAQLASLPLRATAMVGVGGRRWLLHMFSRRAFLEAGEVVPATVYVSSACLGLAVAILIALPFSYGWYRMYKRMQTTTRSLHDLQYIMSAYDKMISFISHEMRNPAHVIKASASMILSQMTPDHPWYWDLHTIEHSAEGLHRIVNDIMALSAIRQEKLEICVGAVDVRSITELLARTHRSFLKVPLTWSVDANVPLMMLTDGTRVSQILMNGLTNAIKYCTEGNITIRVYMARLAQRAPASATNATAAANANTTRHIIFEIADTGVGFDFDPELLFKPFHTAFWASPGHEQPPQQEPLQLTNQQHRSRCTSFWSRLWKKCWRNLKRWSCCCRRPVYSSAAISPRSPTSAANGGGNGFGRSTRALSAAANDASGADIARKGTGLGLPVARMMAEQLGGTVRLFRDHDRCLTLFQLELPVVHSSVVNDTNTILVNMADPHGRSARDSLHAHDETKGETIVDAPSDLQMVGGITLPLRDLHLLNQYASRECGGNVACADQGDSDERIVTAMSAPRITLTQMEHEDATMTTTLTTTMPSLHVQRSLTVDMHGLAHPTGSAFTLVSTSPLASPVAGTSKRLTPVGASVGTQLVRGSPPPVETRLLAPERSKLKGSAHTTASSGGAAASIAAWPVGPPTAAWSERSPVRSTVGLRVLAIDDEAVNRLVMRRMLTKIGCDAVMVESLPELLEELELAGQAGLSPTAASGSGTNAKPKAAPSKYAATATTAATARSFDCICIDISMPGVDGYGVMSALQRAGVRVPCIAVTASDSSPQFARAGFAGFLPKPFDTEALAAELLRVHGGRGGASAMST